MAEHAPYDPVKAHAYYERTKKLKGRDRAGSDPGTGRDNLPPKSSSSGTSKSPSTKSKTPSSTTTSGDRVTRLKAKIKTLEGALSEALAALSAKRQTATKKAKDSSDGKSTEAEKQASQKYRDKHQTELKAKSTKESTSSSSGGDSSSSSSKSVSDMSVEELQQRVVKIQAALKTARQQLSDATVQHGQLLYADLTSNPTFLIHLARPIRRKDSVKMTADFSGYATRNNLRCSDGRTILADAFKDNDGMIVPLVWQHGHDDVDNVLGHVKLENRADGVYAHAYFNQTAKAQNAKEMVRHGDIKFLSIFANGLVEKLQGSLKNVVHGNIREVSLVLAGANPGAVIDNVAVAHSDGDIEIFTDEAVISTGLELELDSDLAHADTATSEPDTAVDDKSAIELIEELDEEHKTAVYYLLNQALTVGSDVQHSDTDGDVVADADNEDDSDGDDNEEGGKDASPAAPVEFAVSDHSDSTEGDANASDEADASDESADSDESNNSTDSEAGDDETVQHDNTNQEDTSMTHNVFDQAKGGSADHQRVTLSHSDVEGIVASAVKGGSLKTAIEDYALQHGIENIDYLFPDSKLLESSPAFISRRMEWVDKVLAGVRKSPFSRIKTITADITPDEARARGYIKGNMKNEEYFALAKRETTPQTVYKKQKLDRDDVIDIVDLDVVAWLKAEMKVMLDEEIAGAILVGDGRSAGDEDKIKEINIRPIASDAELYVTTAYVNLDDASSSIEELVDSVINNRQYYKGSGQPTFYTTEAIISKFLTVKDNFGRRIYASIQEVASVLRVADVVPVEVMERVPDVVGIMVNLSDYTLGADRGGQATMFDDFDIDYNKLRYLIETRLSGALTQPKAALVFRKTAGTNVLATPTEPSYNDTTHVLTVPTVTGVVYKHGATTLTTGSPVTVTSGTSPYVVDAVPASGYYFASSEDDQWTYEVEA